MMPQTPDHTPLHTDETEEAENLFPDPIQQTNGYPLRLIIHIMREGALPQK